MDAITIANAVEKGGIVVTLTLAICGLVWLYLVERRKNDKLLADLMVNNKEMMTALLEVHQAVEGFKEALGGVKSAICDLDKRKK